MKRRDLLLGLTSLGLPIVASSCAGDPNGSGQKLERIRIGFQTIANAELLAKALGLAKEAFPNVKVEYLNFDSGRDVSIAMAAKGIDFGLIGSVGVGVGIARRLPYEVYFIHDLIGTAEALAVRDSIKTVADIRGKKIAVPFGSTTHFSLLSLLKLEGINSNEVTVLDLQPADMVAAWQRGNIDGGYVWQPNLGKLQKFGGKILITSADLAQRGIVTADVGVVRKGFLAKYPQAVKQYVSVLDKAVKFYRQNPQAAAKAIAPELGISPEETLSAMNQLIWLDATEQENPKYLGTANRPGEFAKVLRSSAEFMVSQQVIASTPDLQTYQKLVRSDFL